jgi:hypothetical protein
MCVCVYFIYIYIYTHTHKLHPRTGHEGPKGSRGIAVLSLPTSDILHICVRVCADRDSAVGIATSYGLDGLRIESRCERDFPHSSRPALGPSQPPIQWLPGLSRGVKWPGCDVDHPPHPAPRLKKE